MYHYEIKERCKKKSHTHTRSVRLRGKNPDKCLTITKYIAVCVCDKQIQTYRVVLAESVPSTANEKGLGESREGAMP